MYFVRQGPNNPTFPQFLQPTRESFGTPMFDPIIVGKDITTIRTTTFRIGNTGPIIGRDPRNIVQGGGRPFGVSRRRRRRRRRGRGGKCVAGWTEFVHHQHQRRRRRHHNDHM